MSEEELEDAPRTHSGALLAVIAAALVLAIGGLIWTYTLSSRLTHAETSLTEATQKNVQLAADLRETNARLTVAAEGQYVPFLGSYCLF